MVQIGYSEQRADQADNGNGQNLLEGAHDYQFIGVDTWTKQETNDTFHIFKFQSQDGVERSIWLNFAASGFVGDKAHQFFRMFCLASGVEDSQQAMSNFDTESVLARYYNIEAAYAENKNNASKPHVNVVAVLPCGGAPVQQQSQAHNPSPNPGTGSTTPATGGKPAWAK